MKFWRLASIALMATLLFSACGRKAVKTRPNLSPPQAGAIYSLNDGEGGFRIAKVVASEPELVFVHLFTRRLTARPVSVEAGISQNPAPVAFSPATFSGMQPVVINSATVSLEETESYIAWKNSNSGVL